MKILFIGGTGNISTECASLLAARGHEISVLTRGHTAVPAGYRPLVADRKDPAAFRAAVGGLKPDVVLNFLGYEVAELELDYQVFRGAIRQYVFISSATVYSKPPGRVPITEQEPLGNAWWDYAQKKIACERWLGERRDFPVTIVRPSHTYSKRWIPNAISSAGYSFAARLESSRPVFVPDSGENLWTLTASSDFAVGLAGLLGKPEAIGESFHITSDEALSWNHIYAEIADAVGVRSPKIEQIPTDFICQLAPQLTGNLKGDKAHPGVFDNSKVKRLVPDFQCRVLFRDGIRQSVAWLRAHPNEQQPNPDIDLICDQVISAWQAGPGGGHAA
jgi:nucleoside-diphosphate-sugar epimerase